MRTSNRGRWTTLTTSVVLVAALALPAVSSAVPAKPRGVTGGASHVLGTSALLNAVIFPNNQETTYYFQYGTTRAFGSQTPTAIVAASPTKVRVGQAVNGIQPGVTYYYRVVVNPPPGSTQTPFFGKEKTFTSKGGALKFELAKTSLVTVGKPFLLSGVLRGVGNAGKPVVLQASPYPYTAPFVTIGAPAVTDTSGRFAFRVANISRSTEFRVSTLEPRPLYSPITTVRAALAVVLHVRSSGRSGFVRLYGTVSPAAVGAHIVLQVQKAVTKGRSEATAKYVTQFNTVVKKGTITFSRFSTVVTILRSGRYRAFVKMPAGGPLASGYSNSLVLHAAPGALKKKK